MEVRGGGGGWGVEEGGTRGYFSATNHDCKSLLIILVRWFEINKLDYTSLNKNFCQSYKNIKFHWKTYQ